MRVHIHCLHQPLVESALPRDCRIGGPGPTVAVVTGDVDVTVLPDFTLRLDRAINEAYRTLLVDLSHVGFLSISGVQALVEAQQRADRRSLAMLIASEGPSRRALVVTGASGVLRCNRTVRDALEARQAELSVHTDLDRSLTFPGSSRRA